MVSTDYFLFALNRSGGLEWKLKLSPVSYSCRDVASPAIGPHGTIYVGTWCGYFDAGNPDGELDWRICMCTETGSSAAIDSNGTIYVGPDDPIFAFNPHGAVRWSCFCGFIFFSSPSIAPDGTIYIGTE